MTTALLRCLRNSTLVRWEAAGCPDVGKRPEEGEVIATRSDGRIEVTQHVVHVDPRVSLGHVADVFIHQADE
jgi:hypothetical protein